MRTFAEVYSSGGVKLAHISRIISTTVRDKLDAAGTLNLQCPLDERVIKYLVNPNVIYVYGQQDTEPPALWCAGRIIKVSITETDNARGISIDGRDLIDELRDYTVGIGRQYTAATSQTVYDGLVTLAPGWTAEVDSSIASNLLTARYDGAKALKAIGRTVKEQGVHFRRGDTARVLEVGPFGDRALSPQGKGVRAIQSPSSVTPGLLKQDEVLLIENMSVVTDSDEIVNWAMPTGSGEGAAATTLKYTSYKIFNTDNSTYQAGAASTYPIYYRLNDFGIEEFYIDASDGVAQRQESPVFKEIGPISNSDLAQQYASDALALATMEWLTRMRTALTVYKFSVQHCPYVIKVGQQILLQYSGVAPMLGDPLASQPELRYIDVDELVWVTGVTRQISESGLVQTFEVATIDRHLMDDTDMVVELAEQMQVQNLSVKTRVATYEKTYYDEVGNNGDDAPAVFLLRMKDTVVDVLDVRISFRTFPLRSTTASQAIFASSTYQLWWQLTDGYNYPSDVSLYVNGVDVTADYGPDGLQWNDGGVNAALDVQDLDITQLVRDNGIHNTSEISLYCDLRVGEVRFNSGYPSLSQATASNGKVEMTFNITVLVRDITPG